MSSVRMCDNCGDIFSENADGWTTFSGTQRKRNERGDMVSVSVSQDACPKCSNRFQNPNSLQLTGSPVETGTKKR